MPLKDDLERFFSLKQSQQKAVEQATEQSKVDQIRLEREWFETVELLRIKAEEIVIPPLRIIGEKIDISPFIETPEPGGSYKNTPMGIERLHKRIGHKDPSSLPYVSAKLTIESGETSGSNHGMDSTTYTPGKGISVVCFLRGREMLAQVGGYKYNWETPQEEARLTDQGKIEKLILKTFEQVY